MLTTLAKSSADVELVSKTSLLHEFGLTTEMVEELGRPDAHTRDTASRYDLYLRERVGRWIEENEDRVEQAKTDRASQKVAAFRQEEKRRAEARQKAVEWSDSVKIEAKTPLPDTLLEDAQKQYKFRGWENPLKERALRAYVRHEFTNYDSLIRGLKRCEFGGLMYKRVRNRIDEAVIGALTDWAATRPELRTAMTTSERLVRAVSEDENQ